MVEDRRRNGEFGLPRGLQCPYCTAELRFAPCAQQPLDGGYFGVLSCQSHEFPVIDSIPILRRGQITVQDHVSGSVDVAGPSVAELVAQVRGGQPLEALVSLLAFPPGLPFGIRRVPGSVRSIMQRQEIDAVSLKVRRGHIRRKLQGDLAAQTLQEWLKLFYLRSRVPYELYNYFFLRFCQPRHLASLSLASILPAARKPVLDLACGFGHLMHYLQSRPEPVQVIGVDRNFFQLWGARRWVSPESTFVCADADDAFPFVDGTFSAAVCSDAFHYFRNKAECLNELRRVAGGGTIILDRVGNRLVAPNEGHELSPAEYSDLLQPVGHVIVGERALIDSYLDGSGPRLGPRPATDVRAEKWLSLIMSEDPAVLVDHGAFPAWPHVHGRAAVNPIYRSTNKGATVALRFTFPSKWYAFENAQMASYHPAELTMRRATFDQLRRGQPTAPEEAMVRQCVVIGLPDRYL